MQTAEVINVEGAQAVKLPDEFRFRGQAVSIRKAGEAVIPGTAEAGGVAAGVFRRHQNRRSGVCSP